MASYGVRVKIAFADDPLTASPTWTDIVPLTGSRIREIQIDRGRPSETTKTDTGTATVTGVDLDGLFDPTNATSPYTGQIVPRKQAMIELRDPVLDTWHTIFRGHVDDWKYTLDITRQFFTFQLELVDAFAILAAAELQPGQAGHTVPTGSEGNVFYEDTTGTVDDRLVKILDDVAISMGLGAWPTGLYEIFSGNVRVGEKVYAPGTTALAAIFDAADAEFPGVANAYMNKSGIFTFHGRFARFNPQQAQYGINERNVGDPSLTDSDTDAVPLAELAFTSGSDSIINSCLAYPEKVDAGTKWEPAAGEMEAQLVTDATSIADYGLHGVTFANLQTKYDVANTLDSPAATKLFAEYYVDNYAQPLPRVNQMVFRTKRVSHPNAAALWRHLCRVEISDLLNLTTSHPGGGGFSESFFVEGIHYRIVPLNPDVVDVTLTCDVSPSAYFDANPFTPRAQAAAEAQPGTVVVT